MVSQQSDVITGTRGHQTDTSTALIYFLLSGKLFCNYDPVKSYKSCGNALEASRVG